jgi:hypothetical protein
VDSAIDVIREGTRRLVAGAARIVAACAASWEAAALYENLSRLSDAELERRGIPRGELNRCVLEALMKDT